MTDIVFVFPGQGAQVVGMGRDLFENSPAARAVFAEVDAALGVAISDVCFIGPEERLKQTQFTQPALFAVEVATLAACREAGLEPVAVAGHSIGEYAALVAAGAFDVTTGAKLVQARANAMQQAAEAQPGTMAAVLGLDTDVVRAVCAEVSSEPVNRDLMPVSSERNRVVTANDNCPGQVVISGTNDGVAMASVRLKERGAKRVVPLAVSGAFHSPLMATATDVMREALAMADISDPTLRFISNVTANYALTAAQVKANLEEQVAGPVLWTETIQRFVADGYTTFLECGPGNVLTGLIKRTALDSVNPEGNHLRTYSVGDTASLNTAREALRQ